MASYDDERDRRRYARLELQRVAIGQTAVRDFVGAVKDISVKAVAVEAEMKPRLGDAVALDIQDLRLITGTVSRTLDDGFVVTYDLDEAEEDALIADLMRIDGQIQVEES